MDKKLTPESVVLLKDMEKDFREMLVATAAQLSHRDRFDQIERINLKEAWDIICKERR